MTYGLKSLCILHKGLQYYTYRRLACPRPQHTRVNILTSHSIVHRGQYNVAQSRRLRQSQQLPARIRCERTCRWADTSRQRMPRYANMRCAVKLFHARFSPQRRSWGKCSVLWNGLGRRLCENRMRC